MSFEILTDSSCNLTESTIEKLGIHVASLSYIVNDVEKFAYQKGQEFDAKGFYDALRNKATAKTSQVTPEQAREIVRPILEQGKDLLYVGFSSGLSGTYNAVRLALEELKEEFADRKILHVDTLSASGGQAHWVLEAHKQREEGKPIEEVCKFIEDNRLKLCHWFTVDDLWHLQRGGRLSAGKALIGTMLSVKPLLIVNNEGKLIPMGKAKGRKKSLDALLDKMEQNIEPTLSPNVHIIHSMAENDAQYLADQIAEKHKGLVTNIYALEPVIGTHTGPGVAALVFMGKERE